MRWLSCDPATHTGLVFWDGDKPEGVATLRPAGKREAKVAKVDPERALYCAPLGLERLPVTFASPLGAWRFLLEAIDLVVVEESFGESPKTVAQMGERRGYIQHGCDAAGIPFRTINAEEWKRVCGELLNVAWPNATKESKQRSIDLCQQHTGLVVTGDEGDAYWLGRAALWLGVVKL